MHRPSLAFATLLLAGVSLPALAQDSSSPQPEASTSAGESQSQAMQALRSAQQELRAAAQELQQASASGDQAAVEQARSEIQRAIDAIRQAMTQLPPEQRAELQEGLRQAERGMQLPGQAAAVQAAQQLDESLSRSTGTVVALTTWSYDPLYAEGWRSEEIWDATVVGPNGEEIGEIENVLVGRDGRILSIIAEVGGFWDIGDTHINVPWDQVELGPELERVTIPVNEENVEEFSLFKDWEIDAQEAKVETTQVDDDLVAGTGAWKLTDLLGDYVMLEGGVPYGYVDDVVFGRDGQLKAVVVRPDVTWGAPGYYAYPYPGWHPMLDHHALPYARDEVVVLKPFDYGRLEGGEAAGG